MTSAETEPRAVTRIDEVRWTRRPVLAWSVRLGLVAAPLLLSIALAWSLTALTPQPSGLGAAAARWLVIASISSAALIMLERLARRLVPIAALLDLTLAFPDQAPSRYKVALRTGTTGQLAQRIAEVRSEAIADPSIGAGQRVIELVAALRVHDRITRGHSERVRAYTQMIADEMGLPDDERERLRWAGLLHDVGKLLVPTSILNKVGRLTPDEYEIIKSHPENGRLIIEELVPWLGESARAVWEHHEKWDGSGYPRGLAGEEISLAARIVAVADVYDVMTSARSYKVPVSPKEARAELARCAGSHFDPDVVRAFLNISLGRVRRAAGPLSWLAQLALFPTAAIGSTKAAGSAVVLTGALTASSAGVGTDLVDDTWPVLDSRAMVPFVDTGEGTSTEARDFGKLSGGHRDAIVVVTLPSAVIIESSSTTDGFAFESINIVVVRPATDVQAESVQPASPEIGSGAASPAPPAPSSADTAVTSMATAIAAITTIPPVSGDGDAATTVANPVPPTTATPTATTPTATTSTATTAVPTTTTPTSTSTTIVPGATGTGTTGPATTGPPTTGPQVEPLPPTSPSSTVPTPPVTLPNGKARPVNASSQSAAHAGGRVASAARVPAGPDRGRQGTANGADNRSGGRQASSSEP